MSHLSLAGSYFESIASKTHSIIRGLLVPVCGAVVSIWLAKLLSPVVLFRPSVCFPLGFAWPEQKTSPSKSPPLEEESINKSPDGVTVESVSHWVWCHANQTATVRVACTSGSIWTCLIVACSCSQTAFSTETLQSLIDVSFSPSLCVLLRLTGRFCCLSLSQFHSAHQLAK